MDWLAVDVLFLLLRRKRAFDTMCLDIAAAEAPDGRLLEAVAVATAAAAVRADGLRWTPRGS